MPKKGDRSILFVRGLPQGLLGRVNGLAENLDLARDQFVIKLLEISVRQFEKSQREMKQWWQELLTKDKEEMKTDKGQFDEVLRRMLEKPPQKTSDIKAAKEEAPKPKPSRQK